MKHDGGKGDTPRPFSISLEKFAENFDLIFGKKETKDERPAQEGTLLEQAGDGDTQRMDDQK
jgi:hypothetical protein